MSVYNGGNYLSQSIRSILEQTFTNFEFIIIDDGSTDESWEIISRYAQSDDRIKPMRNGKNVGLTKSLNKGLALAKGEYIARQDVDDLSLPFRIEKQISYLDKNRDIGLLGTAYHTQNDQIGISLSLPPLHDTDIRWQMLFHNAFCHSSVVFRKYFPGVGQLFYDESLSYSQDYELWGRILALSNVENLGEPLLLYRQHPKSIQVLHWDEQQNVASKISLDHLGMLLPNGFITIEKVNTLREWYSKFPRRITAKEVELYRILADVIEKFSNQPNIDRSRMRSVHYLWLKRNLLALLTYRREDIWHFGVLRNVIYHSKKLISP